MTFLLAYPTNLLENHEGYIKAKNFYVFDNLKCYFNESENSIFFLVGNETKFRSFGYKAEFLEKESL